MLRSEKQDAKVGLLVPFYTYHLKQATETFGRCWIFAHCAEHPREPIFIDTDPDWSPNWDNIDAALKYGLDLLLFCNPGNPQGFLISVLC